MVGFQPVEETGKRFIMGYFKQKMENSNFFENKPSFFKSGSLSIFV